MKFGIDDTKLKPIEINKPTKTFFILAYLIWDIVDTFSKPASTIRGLFTGMCIAACLIHIGVIWYKSGNDDDDSDDEDYTPQTTPPSKSRSA